MRAAHEVSGSAGPAGEIAAGLKLTIAPPAIGPAAIWVLAILGTGWGPITAVGGTWRDTYVDVTAPCVDDPSRTLVVMAGVAPMGYIVPAIAAFKADGLLMTAQRCVRVEPRIGQAQFADASATLDQLALSRTAMHRREPAQPIR